LNGLLLVNKPRGISSFDVIRRLRRITGVRKIGHAGTLDPQATGLMLILMGAACKRAAEYSKLDKRYVAEARLGAMSSTGDEEGEKTPVSDRVPTREEIEAALEPFRGNITQVPPVYSAIKIGGREAYKRARAGETVEMPARPVTVYELDVVSYDYPLVALSMKVSSGTYVRTLAQDLGERLGTGAYLSGLVRTEVGELALSDAMELEGADVPAVQRYLRAI
jgi:tRNA pseudouridine55 synthase